MRTRTRRYYGFIGPFSKQINIQASCHDPESGVHIVHVYALERYVKEDTLLEPVSVPDDVTVRHGGSMGTRARCRSMGPRTQP